MKTLTRRAFALFLAVGSLCSVPAAAAEPRPQRSASQEIWARTDLYFGTDRKIGAVTDQEFDTFVANFVTPSFPDGLTLLTGFGQFLNSSGTLIRERSKVLILLYPLSARDANRKIQEIRREYRQQFDQESVLRVDSYALVSF